ncbi:MAG: hypothetical protein WBQ17_00605 [Rhizomicrobium sp.]
MTHLKFAAIAAALVAQLCTSAQAQSYPSFATQKASHGISTNAQVALFWDNLEGGVRKSKNIRNVDHPSTGIFCVHTSVKLNAAATFPIVTVEWLDATTHAPLGAIAEDLPGFDCPNGKVNETIAVRTYDYSTGTPTLSDDVPFYLLII